MRLLDYETFEGQEGSYNDLIKKFVQKVRHYYSEVSGDDFKSAIPELKSMEAKIQQLDRDFGNDHRDYLSELIDELGEESEIENLLLDEFKRTASIIVTKLTGADFNVEEFSFDFSNASGINFLEFYGYTEHKEIDTTANIVRDVLQSICSKHKVVFIDSSRLTE